MGLYTSAAAASGYTVGLLYSCLQVGHGHSCVLIWLLILFLNLFLVCQFAMTLSKYLGIKAYPSHT